MNETMGVSLRAEEGKPQMEVMNSECKEVSALPIVIKFKIEKMIESLSGVMYQIIFLLRKPKINQRFTNDQQTSKMNSVYQKV